MEAGGGGVYLARGHCVPGFLLPWGPRVCIAFVVVRSGREPCRDKRLWSRNAELLNLIRWKREVLLWLTRATLFSHELLPLKATNYLQLLTIDSHKSQTVAGSQWACMYT